MVSRNYRTIGLPSLRRTGYSGGLKSNHVRVIQAFEDLAASARTHITFGHIQQHLDCLWQADTAWHHWAQYAEPLVRTFMGPGTPTHPESSQEHAHPSHCQSGSQDQRKNPFEFRQCPLTLLRYLGGLLALTGYQSSDLSQWLHDDLFVIRSFGAQKTRVLAAQYTPDQDWFQDTWLPRAVAALPAYPSITGGRDHDGFLFSLLPSPIYEEENTRLFSAIVHGLGRPRWKDCEAALGRMEFLALEVVFRLRSALLSNKAATEWRSIEDEIECDRERCTLSVVWAPHKLIYDTSSSEMRSSAHGSNARADVLLVVHGPAKKPVELCTVYHTTNVPESTWSGRTFAIIPESRLLARCNPFLSNLLDRSVQDLAGGQPHYHWVPRPTPKPTASPSVTPGLEVDIALASVARAHADVYADAEHGADEHLGFA